MQGKEKTMEIQERILMGPGPSGVDPRVRQAMAAPVIGHLDPDFLAIMDETTELLRYVFETGNRLTIPMSGTGSAGMETALVNFLEPGDVAVICVNGVFGERMADIAERCGARVKVVEAPWGEAIDPEDVRRAIAGEKVKLVAVVHAETSTGVLQPLEEIAEITHAAGALLVVDAVTSLGGVPVRVDQRGIDVCYSGTQKCLSCPPGLAPITVSPRAEEVLEGRKGRVPSWYLDLSMIRRYWGSERFYHHTAPVSMIYALREALRLDAEEGLEQRYRRHRVNAAALEAGLRSMGLQLFVRRELRLPSLLSVVVPDGVDDARLRRELLADYGIEIGGGLGKLRGKIVRIGVMGYSSQRKNVMLLLAALEDCLSRQGFRVPLGESLRAALRVYEQEEADTTPPPART